VAGARSFRVRQACRPPPARQSTNRLFSSGSSGVDEQFTQTVSEMPACTQAICARAAVSALTGGRAMARTRNGPTGCRGAMRGHYRERSPTAVNGQKCFPRSAQSGAPTTPPLPHRPEFVVDGQRVVNNQILSFISVPRTKLNRARLSTHWKNRGAPRSCTGGTSGISRTRKYRIRGRLGSWSAHQCHSLGIRS